ncbi:MAG: DHHA1 domain-containing protein, partial [Bacteroidetes bacterium]|nr:DHHA1 domain-containing protein [Bacteroidota bacterium]
RENIQLKVENQVPIEVAKTKGAMALFGEKYGDFVRMVTFDDDYSVELCGGTHVAATGNIGLFKIIAESSIAAGVRRIEAITAEEAEEYINEQLSLISGVRESLKNPPNLEKAIGDLINERNRLTKEVDIIRYQQESELKKSLGKTVIKESGINFVIKQLGDVSSESVRNVSFQLNKEVDNLFMVIAGEKNNKPHISITINKKLVEEKGLHAGKMVKELSKEIKGGGGGQAFFATAGGNDVKGLSKVIDKTEILIKELLAIDLEIN